MQINIKTSEANQEIVRQLTNKLPTGTKENVIARIALGYSLQNGKKFWELYRYVTTPSFPISITYKLP